MQKPTSAIARLGFALLVFVAAASPSFGQFVFTPFTVPSQGLVRVDVNGINNNGDVAGTLIDARGYHAFIRSHDGTIQVIDVPGAGLTQAGGINDAGDISGTVILLGSNATLGFIRNASGAYSYFSGPDVSGMSSVSSVIGLNNAGECIVYPSYRDTSAYLRTSNDDYTLLPRSATEYGYTALNNSGEAAGSYGNSGFVLNLSTSTFKFFQAGASATATLVTGLNDAGDTVGIYEFGLNFLPLGFFRSADASRADLFLPPFINSFGTMVASGVNNAGEIAGAPGQEQPYIATPASDNTPPSTSVVSVIPGPPKKATFSVVDPQSGIFLVAPIFTNAKVVVSPFVPGQKTPVIVTATKLNQNHTATIEIQTSDMDGNYALFDPQLITVPGDPAAAPLPLRDLPAKEHVVVAANGTPGLESLHIKVNDKLLSFRLKDGQKKTINIREEMVAGRNNVVTFSGEGPAGSDALVVLMQPSSK